MSPSFRDKAPKESKKGEERRVSGLQMNSRAELVCTTLHWRQTEWRSTVHIYILLVSASLRLREQPEGEPELPLVAGRVE